MNYPGGKNAVYRHIINQIPPHSIYVEAFSGSAAVLRHKLPAAGSLVIDKDPAALRLAMRSRVPGALYILGDGILLLRSMKLPVSAIVYLDPPYPILARRAQRAMYNVEMSDADHIALLDVARGLRCRVLISGYRCPLYDDALRSWRRVRYRTTTRGGASCWEYLWFNFPRPEILHDYRYTGSGFRERERLKRKKQRWIDRIKSMPALERNYLLAAVSEYMAMRPAISPDLTMCDRRRSTAVSAIPAVIGNNGDTCP